MVLVTAFLFVFLRQHKTNLVSEIHKLIEETEESMHHDLHGSIDKYKLIMAHYNKLPKRAKRKVYKKTMEVYHKINERRY